MLRTLALVAALLLCAPALAHSPLTGSVPAKGSTVSTAPQAISLTFASPARVMKVEIEKDGTTERLDVPSRDLTKQLDVPNGVTGPGTYKVLWRAMGEDGHILKGDFSFTVKGQ